MKDKEIKQMIMNGEIDQVPQKALDEYLQTRDVISGLPANAIKYLIHHGMIRKVPNDELMLMLENEEARKYYTEEGIDNVYKMVCLQAVDDYKSVRKGLTYSLSRDIRENMEKHRDTLEDFFKSEFFLSNSGCGSADEVVKAIEQQMRRDAQRALVI